MTDMDIKPERDRFWLLTKYVLNVRLTIQYTVSIPSVVLSGGSGELES